MESTAHELTLILFMEAVAASTARENTDTDDVAANVVTHVLSKRKKKKAR